LKELDLTEGKATGIPTIIRSLKNNGSPAPVFDTNQERSYFQVTLYSHPDFIVNDAVNDAVNRRIITTKVKEALIDTIKVIADQEYGASINDIMHATSKSNATVKRYLQLLREINLIEFRGSPKTGRYNLTKQMAKKIGFTQ